MNWRKMMPEGKYLAAHNLNDKDVTVTIDKVVGETILGQDGKSDNRPVAYFKGAKLPMVLNVTNCKVLSALYGFDTDQWIGKAICIYPTTIVDKRTKEVLPCLRFRAPRKQAEIKPPVPAEREPGSDDDDETPVKLTK